MTCPLKPGMRVEYVRAGEPWQATVARVDEERFWLRDYSDEDESDIDIDWIWSPHVFRIITPDYTKYPTLDDIPITPGRVEWSGRHFVEAEYEVRGKTSASYNQYVRAAANSPEHRYGAIVGQVIHDACAALCGPESDEVWLRKRGAVMLPWRSGCGVSVSVWQHDVRIVFDHFQNGSPNWPIIRRAVEALESGET